jgi:hypothetical protein
MPSKVLRAYGSPRILILTLLAIATSVSLARWCGPVHAAIGLDDVLPVVIVSACATITSILSWHWVHVDDMWRVRIAQIIDFPMWGMAPVMVAWCCSEAAGAATAIGIHGGMGLYWATLVVRRSWSLKCSVLLTWAPIFMLSGRYGWMAPVAIATLFLFVISNEATLLRRTIRREERAQELDHLRGDYQTLLEHFNRLRRELRRARKGVRAERDRGAQ